MSKIANYILGMIFVATSLHGQNITKEEIQKFKIRSIVTFDDYTHMESTAHYDQRGDLVRTVCKKDGKILNTIEFVYDSNRMLTTEKLILPTGETRDIRRYIYNPQKQLVKEESYVSDFSVAGVWESEYDSLGKKVKSTQKTDALAGNATTYMRYIGTQLVEETVDDSIQGPQMFYKYNDRGQLMEMTTKGAGYTLSDRYIYNDSGKLIQVNEMTTAGESGRRIFKYSSQGLLQKEVWQSLVGKDRHQITYTVVMGNNGID